MSKNPYNRSLFVMLSVLSIIISVTYFIGIIARGYIPEYDNGLKIKATGLLSATSIPKNANVIINDKLYTATDDTINLVPGDYQLQITKDGYLPWTKKINIQKELVTRANAILFKTNPKLIPLIHENILNPTINQNLTQIIFIYPPSPSNPKPGIYLIEANFYLSFVLDQYQPKFITQNPFPNTDKTITFTFSPNSKQVILKSSLRKNTYLIDLTTGIINQPTEKTSQEWLDQSKQMDVAKLYKLPKIFLSTVATKPASISFSDDENMILYSKDNQYQIYDIEKNQNYPIGAVADIHLPFWLPKSNSLIHTNLNKIKSIEFDGTNSNTIFSHETNIKAIIPQFNGENLIIATSENIYTLSIK